MNSPRDFEASARPPQANRNGDHYLEAAIRTASPAKLRLMLIERAVEVSARLAESWREPGGEAGPNEHSLKLLDLLTELLGGVTGGRDSNLCREVADLYVFLSQHLTEAETKGDPMAIDEIRVVLEIEAETWRQVCLHERPAGDAASGGAGQTPSAGGLNLEA